MWKAKSKNAVLRPCSFARVSRLASLVLASLALSLLAGCHIERIVLEEPVRDQFIEVDTEDHIAVRLDENGTTGYEWTARCSDPLVDVLVEHDEADDDEQVAGKPGLANVRIHVHRGFIGPAVVYMRYARSWSGDCARRVKLHLYRRPTDVAAWR